MGLLPSCLTEEQLEKAKRTGVLVLSNKQISSVPQAVHKLGPDALRLLDLSGNQVRKEKS